MSVVYDARPPRDSKQRYFKGLTGISGTMAKARVMKSTYEFPEPDGATHVKNPAVGWGNTYLYSPVCRRTRRMLLQCWWCA